MSVRARIFVVMFVIQIAWAIGMVAAAASQIRMI